MINKSKFNKEGVARRCSVKKMFLKISQNSQENTCARVSFLVKLQEILNFAKFLRAPFFIEHLQWLLQACNFIKKETQSQVFSCEFCEISKNTFFHGAPLVAASDYRFSILNFQRNNKGKFYAEHIFYPPANIPSF